MTTYADFAAQTRRELEEATAGVWADESLLAWCNEAALDIAKRAENMEDQVYTTSVANQQTYDLPDYTLEVRQFTYGDKPLDRVPIQSWTDITASGTPYAWDIMNRAIYLYPVPTVAATVTLFRRRSPEPIASITATTPMPFESRHDALIRNYVKAQASMQVTDLNSFNTYMQAYEAGVVNAWVEERQEEVSLYAGTPRTVW